MSTVLYVQGDGIYTDSKYVKMLGDTNIAIKYGQKIFITPCKKYIYANTGSYTFGDIHKHTGNVFDKFYNEHGNRMMTNAVPNIEGTPISTGSLLVYSTQYGCWIHNKDKDETESINLDGVPYYAVGSGAQTAMAYMRLTGDPNLAILRTLHYDRLSGGDTQYVSFDELKMDKEG